jgi:protoporphyrinogen IX oxidase
MTAIRLAGPGLVPGPFFDLRPLQCDGHNGLMSSSYLWVKAFHIVFVASWFAGLFYLPRLFVNLAMVAPDSHAERERLLLMARKLYRFSSLLMVPALVLGVVLWLGYGIGRGPGSGWMHAKLVLVLGVIGYHHVCRSLLRSFEQLKNQRSHRWYRVFNEVSVLMFAATVVLVVVKPF